jgi:hypothetical protein
MRYWEYRCALCSTLHYCSYMEEREDGFYCDQCAVLPPFNDKLYSALVSFQRLFRAHFAAKAKPCGSCKKQCLKLYDYYTDIPSICIQCVYEEQEQRQCPYCYEERCRCDDGSDWCEKCECPFGTCICAELKEERESKRIHHCGDPECAWNCGVLRCGCIDICRNHDCDD